MRTLGSECDREAKAHARPDPPGTHVIAGSVLQIVSAPGQSYLRPPGPVVMQTMSQAGALNALGSKPPAGGPGPAPVTPPGRVL